MPNSLIEAQEDFSAVFGPLSLSDLCKPDLVLPHFSREKMELDEFIENHQKPAPVVIGVEKTQYHDVTHYKFSH